MLTVPRIRYDIITAFIMIVSRVPVCCLNDDLRTLWIVMLLNDSQSYSP